MTASPSREVTESQAVTGRVERIVYHNPDDGWCVLKVKVKGRRRLVTVVGHSSYVVPGETIEAQGEWTEHAEHGERLIASTMRTTLPSTAGAAEKYLSSGLVKGIGPQLAHRLVERFGAEVFSIIEEAPNLLRDVEGIGPQRVESIRRSWSEQMALKDVMNFLGSHGLSATKAPRILRTFGPDALSIIENNPYRLAREVPGIGFKSADLIARHTGLEPDSEERFASAIHDRLQKAIARGHCAYPAEALLREASKEVGFPPERLVAALEAEVESGRLTEEPMDAAFGSEGKEVDGIFPSGLAAAEMRVAQSLVRLASRKPQWISAAFLDAPFDPSKAPRTARLRLSESQERALRTVLNAKLSVLTGGPGTGKTTLIRAISYDLRARGWHVVCAAPTGRAAQRLMEAAGVEAQTIHRLLGWDPETHGFRYRPEFPLRADLLIVDEASMVGLELMDSLLQALPPHAALLLVGDRDQLPSVQAGRVLDSVLDSGVFAHAHLSEVFRQANGRESLIIRAAHEVLEGRLPELTSIRPDQEFHFVEARTPEACLERVVRLVKERIPERFGLNPQKDVQVLCPMNKGEVGARSLNRRLQAALNPEPPETIERFGQVLAVGDKVIITANDYDKDVYNGDIGRIVQIERERSSLRVELNAVGDRPGRRIDFDFAELDALSLAFAITVHKAQGSEYEAVVIPLHEESAAMLGKNLVYTAITRGKKLVVLVGNRESLRLAVRAQPHLERRWSGLAGKIRAQAKSLTAWRESAKSSVPAEAR